MSTYPPNGQYPGQYPGQFPGQYPDPSSQPPAQAYPYPGHQQPGYGGGNQPGYTPSAQVANQPGTQGPFQPVVPTYAYGAPGQQGPQQPKKNTGLIVGLIAFLAVALIAGGIGVFLLMRGNDDADSTAATTATASPSAHAEPSDKPTRASTSPSPSPSPTRPTPSATPSAAAGTQEVTGPSTGITFAISNGWTTGVGGASDPGGLLPDSTTSGLDAYAYAPLGLPQVQLQKEVAPLSSAPGEAFFQTVLDSQAGATFSSYETFTTPNGDGSLAYFTVGQDGITAYGAIIMAKTSSGGYATLSTATLTESQSKELTQSVVASIH